MNSRIKNIMVSGVMTAVSVATVAQAAFADHGKVTTITTRNYAPVSVETPVIITSPATTTTTVRRTIETPVVMERAPVMVERQILTSPVVQERRVEIMNNASPSSSTTVTRTTIEAQ